MMTEESIRQWKEVQKNKIEQLKHPSEKEKEQIILNTINTILEEE